MNYMTDWSSRKGYIGNVLKNGFSFPPLKRGGVGTYILTGILRILNFQLCVLDVFFFKKKIGNKKNRFRLKRQAKSYVSKYLSKPNLSKPILHQITQRKNNDLLFCLKPITNNFRTAQTEIIPCPQNKTTSYTQMAHIKICSDCLISWKHYTRLSISWNTSNLQRFAQKCDLQRNFS